MAAKDARPPKWGPAFDPTPWPHWDPIPWPWKHVPFPGGGGDPIPFPYKKFENIRVQDVIALRQVRLNALSKVFDAQMNAERELLEQELEILKKYK
jgi:hypothetical protein